MTRQRAIFKRRKAARSEETILSFKLGYINLMITLVPFLLSIAVFSRLAVLDLHLPKLSSQGGGASSPRRLALTVEIEERGIAVSDGPERLAFFSNREGEIETEPLSILMQKLKGSSGGKRDHHLKPAEYPVRGSDLRHRRLSSGETEGGAGSNPFPRYFAGGGLLMLRRIRRKKGEVPYLNLISLMDMFTILVIFLLFQASNEGEALPISKNVILPLSTASQPPDRALTITVTSEEISLDGAFIVGSRAVLEKEAPLIEPLHERLLSIGGRRATILGDRKIPFALLKKVMRTVAEAGIDQLSLAVLSKESS